MEPDILPMAKSTIPHCPFCTLDSTRIIASNNHAQTIMDDFPISIAHALVIPRRHIYSLFEATRYEIDTFFDLLGQASVKLLGKHISTASTQELTVVIRHTMMWVIGKNYTGSMQVGPLIRELLT